LAIVPLTVGATDSNCETNSSCQGPEVSPACSSVLEAVVGIDGIEGIDSWLEPIVVGVIEVDAAIAATNTVMEPQPEQ